MRFCSLPSDNFIHKDLRINSYGSYLRRRFECRVSKVNVDCGFTCPNRDGSKGEGGCIFCDNRSFSPTGTRSEVPLELQIAEGMRYHRRRLRSEKFIIYFQKFTNTYAGAPRLRDLYSRAVAHPDVLGISVGTRPDAVSADAVDILSKLAEKHYVCVELGLQSADDSVLRWMNRGHTFEEYLRAVERLAGRGIEICTHLIYGFPGGDREGFLRTADLMGSLPISSLKIHQLHAVKGTRLAEMVADRRYVPITLPDYVGTVCDFLERLPAQVAIQRLYGSAPLDMIVAPRWGLKNNRMWYTVVNELARRGTWQGCRSGCDSVRSAVSAKSCRVGLRS